MNGTLDQGQIVGGRWRIDQYLASGGFGQVYSATDVSSAAIGSVAVKVLLEGASTAERQSFLAEAVHMSALRHPNLVAHIDSGMLADDDGAVFLVIDLCDESLREHCDRQTSGTLRPERLQGLVEDIGAGLDYLHRSGRVHRDLKPGNILRAADRWKLADFGLVRDLSQSGVYHLQSLVGSPRYMAPEFFSDGMVGPAADIWAVGIIVHEVMTGQTVYAGEGPAYIHNVTSGAPTIASGLPPAAADLVRRCLAADPAQRPAADQLGPILAGAAGQAAAIPGPVPSGDDITARVAPPPQIAPQAAPQAPAGAEAANTTGPPAGQVPPTFPPPTGQPSEPGVQPVAPAAASVGTPAGAPPILPPAPTEEANSSKRRLALLAGLGALALVGLAAWALFSGGDDAETETAGSAEEADGETETDPLAPDASDDDGDNGTENDDADGGAGADTEDGTAEDEYSTVEDDGTEADDEAGAGDEDAEEADAAPAVENPRSMVALDQFIADECADVGGGDRFVIDTVVPCADPHLFQVLAVYEAPQAGGEFPGPDALFQLGIARCPQAFLDRFGTDQVDTSLSVLSFGPNEEDWEAQVYSVVCVMYRSDLQPISGPIGDDVQDWLWKPGDSITAVELQRGHCFDTPVPLEIQGFGQRVTFADCEEPHDGQYFDSVLLEQPEGGYTDPLAILADGKPLCHDALHDRYGDDHRESGFTDTVMVQSPAEYQQSPTNLLLCIVLWDEPTAGTLEDIVAE